MRYVGKSLYTALPTNVTGGYWNDATSFKEIDPAGQQGVTLTPNGSDRLQNPFTISIGRHNSNQVIAGQNLVLIIPPSTLSISSNQVVDSQFTREGFLPTIWGPGQVTLSASGQSPAFMLDKEGLSSPLTRTDSLGYRHLMSLVKMFKSNGYQRLTRDQDPYPGSHKTNSRVPHVLDAVVIGYDGTEYFGHFTSFSLEVSASNPFRFSYSFEYVASGLKGDYAEGHLCDGSNQSSGIVLSRQGSRLVEYQGLVGTTGLVNSTLDAGTGFDTGVTGISPEGTEPPPVLDKVLSSESSFNTYMQLMRGSEFISQFNKFREEMFSRGYRLIVTSGVRDTPASQANANASSNGQNTPFGSSLHQYGAAMDFNLVHIESKRQYTTRQSRADWLATGVADAAKACHMVWGGNFKKYDPIHVGYVANYGDSATMLAFLQSRAGSSKEKVTTDEE